MTRRSQVGGTWLHHHITVYPALLVGAGAPDLLGVLPVDHHLIREGRDLRQQRGDVDGGEHAAILDHDAAGHGGGHLVAISGPQEVLCDVNNVCRAQVGSVKVEEVPVSTVARSELTSLDAEHLGGDGGHHLKALGGGELLGISVEATEVLAGGATRGNDVLEVCGPGTIGRDGDGDATGEHLGHGGHAAAEDGVGWVR